LKISEMDPKDRIYEHCDYVMKKKEEKIKNAYCEWCWLPRISTGHECICNKMSKIEDFDCNVKIIVYMHFKEFFRASNTAKIIQITSRKNSELLIYGKREDEARLVELCREDPTHTFILFPSVDSISVPQLFERHPDRKKDDSSNSANTEKLKIIVLDGTWGNAATIMRHCSKIIPSELKIPCVRLDPKTLSIFTRTQTQPDRICTLESIVLLLQELGESQKNQDLLLNNMKINMEETHKSLKNCKKKVRPNFKFMEKQKTESSSNE